MAVDNELSCFGSGVSPAEKINYIVKSALADTKKVFTGDTLLALSHEEILVELAFLNTVVTLSLLLCSELKTVLRGLLAALAMLTGGIRTALKSALVAVAALTLEVELLALAAAHLADRTCISCHVLHLLKYWLHAPSLGRAAAVVGNGSRVLYQGDFKTRRLQRSYSGFSAGSGALNINLNRLHTVLHSSLSSYHCNSLSSKGSRFS